MTSSMRNYLEGMKNGLKKIGYEYCKLRTEYGDKSSLYGILEGLALSALGITIGVKIDESTPIGTPLRYIGATVGAVLMYLGIFDSYLSLATLSPASLKKTDENDNGQGSVTVSKGVCEASRSGSTPDSGLHKKR